MYICSNGVKIIEDAAELPPLSGHTLYMDFETTSRDPTLDSLDPWHHCWIAGICIAVDAGSVYYVPVGHVRGSNVDREMVISWLTGVLAACTDWANHNIKYDAHCMENDFGLVFAGRLIDTTVLAKLYHSDLFDYSLDKLMTLWLPDAPGKAGDMLAPYLIENKDYGQIPIDILGHYGGQDVICNRRLYHFLTDLLPEDCRALLAIEIGVTKILYDVERLGMRTNPELLKAMNIYYMTQMLAIEKQISELSGYNISPHVNADCYDLLCNRYNLPVLKWTKDEDGEDRNPSFAKDALNAYLSFPSAPVEVIQLMIQYRQMNTFRSLFLETYLRLHLNGVLHPRINQAVRTGRMSVQRPNSQQLSKDAKKLIMPEPGHAFLSVDYSQIEFRLIVHYTQTESAIAAYNENPDTDFHQWVADMCGIARRPAKTVNFCMGYGGGKDKLIEMLKNESMLMDELRKKIESSGCTQAQMFALFDVAATQRASAVYATYHKALSRLKGTARTAAKRAESRGFVFNLFGRRRHLAKTRSHLAFNALNQSTAADIMKSQLVSVWPICQRLGIRITALVHDELLFHGPTEVVTDPTNIRELIECLEIPQVKLAIPLRCTYGVSDKSWYEAGLPELKWPLGDSTWHH